MSKRTNNRATRSTNTFFNCLFLAGTSNARPSRKKISFCGRPWGVPTGKVNLASRNFCKQRKLRKQQASNRGTSILELVFGIALIVPLVLYAIDLSLIVFSVSIANSVVHSCCRLAANGPPAELKHPHESMAVKQHQAPYHRAILALKNRTSNLQEIDPQLEICESIHNPLPVSPLGGVVHGELKVKLNTRVKLPLPLPGIGELICIPAEQTMPYTWTVPPVIAKTDAE